MDLGTQILQMKNQIDQMIYELNLMMDLYLITEGHPYCPPYYDPIPFDAIKFAEGCMG